MVAAWAVGPKGFDQAWLPTQASLKGHPEIKASVVALAGLRVGAGASAQQLFNHFRDPPGHIFILLKPSKSGPGIYPGGEQEPHL